MKKIINLLLLVSFLGIILTAYLVFEFYFPIAAEKIISCGTGIQNSCLNLVYSGYSSIFGIPLAAFGLFFYLFVFFTMLIIEYAKDEYYLYGFTIVASLSLFSILVDIVLFGILVYVSIYCTLCILSYLLNIVILLLCYFWYKEIIKNPSYNLKSIIKKIFIFSKDSSDKKAVAALYIIFTFLLLISILIVVSNLKSKSKNKIYSQKEITEFTGDFYSKDKINLNLPETTVYLGSKDAIVKIDLFTDFFCTACYSFYNLEKYLLSRYKGKILIRYYNYPLQEPCDNVESVKKLRSCLAAKAVLAAAKINKTEEYIINHYENYKKIKNSYTEKVAIGKLPGNYSEMDFKRILYSKEINDLLNRDIKIANKLNINQVPTLFINGRKLIGVPPIQYFDAIVKKEITSKK